MTDETHGEEYIVPLELNGMKGRMMHIPAKPGQEREIMVLYGHHALLERWYGLVANFNDFGAVTMPDIPGFGGMDSFYRIGKSATIDNYADYLADFIVMHYGKRRISIVGISFGFVVATRMLQRHPELSSQIDFLVSASGFMKRDDFTFSWRRYWFYRVLASVMVVPPMTIFFRYVILDAKVLRIAYGRTNNAKYKFAEVEHDKDRFRQMMDMEVRLWQENDVRSYMRTTLELLTIDNTIGRVALPVWHVYTEHDHFFDARKIEKHMRQVFSDFYPATMHLKTHTLSVLANKAESAVLIPDPLRDAITRAKPSK